MLYCIYLLKWPSLIRASLQFFFLCRVNIFVQLCAQSDILRKVFFHIIKDIDTGLNQWFQLIFQESNKHLCDIRVALETSSCDIYLWHFILCVFCVYIIRLHCVKTWSGTVSICVDQFNLFTHIHTFCDASLVVFQYFVLIYCLTLFVKAFCHIVTDVFIVNLIVNLIGWIW